MPPGRGGTINLFQREVDKPADVQGFARATLAGMAAAIHYPVLANDTLFLGCASIGPDAYAVAGVSEALKARIGPLRLCRRHGQTTLALAASAADTPR